MNKQKQTEEIIEFYPERDDCDHDFEVLVYSPVILKCENCKRAFILDEYNLLRRL